MIRSFRHLGLKRLYTRNDRSGISAEHLPRIMAVLDLLDVASVAQEMDLPGFHLHPLRGDLRGFWSMRISGNFRVVFRMEDGDVFDVDLIDYHYR